MSDDTTPTASEDASADATGNAFEDLLRKYGADDEVIAKIRDLGATSVDDLSALTAEDFVGAGMKLVQARKLVASLVTPTAPAVDSAAAAMSSASLDTILPKVPDDGSWLESLKTGGVAKVDRSTVLAAVRAGLASRTGLFDVPALLVQAMEAFADTNDEPVDPVFFGLRKQLARRTYAEVFQAIPGLEGSFVTEARKQQLFQRINDHLWPAIISFNEQLKAWQDAWMQGAANPGMFMAALAASSGGGMGMPPGMMSPPPTDALRDQADAIADAVNRVFSGTGVQIASALAYDAAQIKDTLEDPRLPALIGAANRDQMLKQLGVGVNATYPRLELNLTRFVLACMQAKDQPGGNEELQYFGALFMLGSQIPWNELTGGGSRPSAGVTAIGGLRSDWTERSGAKL